MATTARRWSAASVSTDRSRPLLRPPAMSTTESKPADGGEGGVGRRGLGVVVPARRRRPSATSCTRWARPRNVRSTWRTPSRVAPPSRAVADAARALLTSWGRSRHSSSRSTIVSPAAPTRALAGEVVVGGVVDAEGHRAAPRVAPGHDDRVVGVGDGDAAAGPEVGPDAGLGVLVALDRVVDVEVVLGEVQPRGHRGLEVPGVAEPERRRLDHEHVELGPGDGLDQRDVGVAHGQRRSPRRLEHLGDEGGDGGLAVGAGDGHQRPVVPRRGQVELAEHRHRRPPAPPRTRDGGRARRGWAARRRLAATSVANCCADGASTSSTEANSAARRAAGAGWSSTTVTTAPWPTSAATMAWPVTPYPTTSGRAGDQDGWSAGVVNRARPGGRSRRSRCRGPARCRARRGSRTG